MWFPDVNQIKTKPSASKKKANKNSDAKAKKQNTFHISEMPYIHTCSLLVKKESTEKEQRK